MMKKKINFLLVLVGFFGNTLVNAQDVKKVYGFNHVESVVSDGEFLYVADVGLTLKPSDKDGDGKIMKVDKDGKVISPYYVRETLNAPKGLAIANGVLFATDIDKIIAFELKTGNKLYEVSFAGESNFLNDIVVWDNTTLYVSATDKSKLYKVDLSENKFEAVASDVEIKGTNGLYADKENNRLYVNGFGSNNTANGIVGYINLADNKFTQITPIEGLYDGIQIYEGILYFTNWMEFDKKGIVASYDLTSKKLSVMQLPEHISGPADFTIFRNRLVVPGMMDGTLHFITIQKDSMYIH